MKDMRPLWIARLAGDQKTMGRQHGELAATGDLAEKMLAYYPHMPERLLIGDAHSAVQHLARAVVTAAKELALTRLERARPAELRERTRAFMVAAGRSASEARYLGVMDLFQNLVGTAARFELGPFGAAAKAIELAAAVPACSTVMAWGRGTADGAMRHARNFDFPGVGVWDASPALVLCAPDFGQRYGFIAARGADVPVVTVFNQAGLVITTHTRFHRKIAFGGAAIVDIVHEIARRAESLADAVRIASERPSSSTWGIAISSTREERAICLELHAQMARVVEAAPGASFVMCTNRYRHPDMQVGQAAASGAWAEHSDARERRLRALAEPGALTSEAMMAMLADREDRDAPGVRRHLGGVVANGCTVHSVVVEPATQSLLLSVGEAPACDGPFVRVRWDWDGPVGAWDVGADGSLTVAAAAGVAISEVEIPGVGRDEAGRHVAAAVREEQSTHDKHAIAAALERAIAAAPDDPSLRMGAAWTHLRRGDAVRALGHVRAGLLRETLPYRRGQLLLWGARAALARRDDETAGALWDELERLTGAGAEVDELRVEARADRARPRQWRGPRPRKPEVNLSMLDAR